jgi:hypothetical protein
MGQVVVNNELFGQQGSANQGQGLPPNLPPVPTAGPTPTFTPTPTETATPSPGPTETPTSVPTIPPTPVCRTRFESPVVAGDQFIPVTGGLGAGVPILVRLYWVDGTNNQVLLDTQELEDFGPGHTCPGHADFYINPANFVLQANMLLIVHNEIDDSSDYTFVLEGTPTATPIPSNTPLPTSTPTPSQTPTPSATPVGPYIGAIPACWSPGTPNYNVELIGGNWPTSPASSSPINLYLRDRFGNTSAITTIPQGHGGSFNNVMVNVSVLNPSNSPYYFEAQATNGSYSVRQFDVPCIGPTPVTPSPTPSPDPADLVIVSYPTLVSTPPIQGYEPVTFSYVITNTGNVDITTIFYIDTYFDPVGVTSTTVPISYKVKYQSVEQLAGGESQTITMTVNGGFPGIATSHTVYGMVDSIEQIAEEIETNNITQGLVVAVTPPLQTPTPTPTPSGSDIIAGVVRIFTGSDWVPQFRAEVYIIQTSGVATPTVVSILESSMTGGYFFNQAITGETYTVYACYTLSGITYTAGRPGIVPYNPYVDLFMRPSQTGCPYP